MDINILTLRGTEKSLYGAVFKNQVPSKGQHHFVIPNVLFNQKPCQGENLLKQKKKSIKKNPYLKIFVPQELLGATFEPSSFSLLGRRND